MEYNVEDNETLYLIKESSEEAKDLLVEKYKYIIDIIMNKYKRMGYLFKVDRHDMYQEAMLGFASAINKYEPEKNTSLATFITLCVDRKLSNMLRQAGRLKNKLVSDSVSLNQVIDGEDPLVELISDDNNSHILTDLAEKERYLELKMSIEQKLSPSEYEVFELMLISLNYSEIASLLDKSPKQIDNAMQRIKYKTKKILDNRK